MTKLALTYRNRGSEGCNQLTGCVNQILIVAVNRKLGGGGGKCFQGGTFNGFLTADDKERLIGVRLVQELHQARIILKALEHSRATGDHDTDRFIG